MKEIAKGPAVDPAFLSGEFYVQSLLGEGRRANLITEAEAGEIRTECIRFLAGHVTRYTRGNSSSVRVELAQNILQSILYTIGIFLKTLAPEEAVSALKSTPVSTLYDKGRRKINVKLKTAKHFHAMVLRSLTGTRNETYHATFTGGIRGFFKLYDADFAAHEIHITADYPLSNPVTGLTGVEFIIAYLRAALLENEFCGRFRMESIEKLMCGFHEEYDTLVINLFDQVLASSVGCVLTGTRPEGLVVPQKKVMGLQSLWLLKTKGEVEALVCRAGNALMETLGIPDGPLREYARQSLSHISENIYLAIQTLTLDKVFVG